MFAELGAFIYRNKWATLVVSAVFLAISVAVVVHGGRLTGGSYGDNEAERTEGLSARVLGHATNTTFIAIFHSDTLDPRNEPFQAAMKAALLPLANDPAVLEVMGPDESPPGMTIGMVAGNAKSAVAMVSLKGDFKEALALYPEVRQKLRSDVLQISCTGQVPFMDNLDRVLQKDL